MRSRLLKLYSTNKQSACNLFKNKNRETEHFNCMFNMAPAAAFPSSPTPTTAVPERSTNNSLRSVSPGTNRIGRPSLCRPDFVRLAG